jgi:hypothetical protein
MLLMENAAGDETLRTTNDARGRGSKISSKSHQCPYCKCAACKKVWDRNKGDAVVNRDLLPGTLLVNLPDGHTP